MITPARVIPYLLILILLFFVGWQIYQAGIEKERRLSENRQFQERVAKSLAAAKTAVRRADSLQASFENRRVADSLALMALKMRNKGMSKNVQILREPVQPLIDSIQALGRFVSAYDSLSAAKDNLLLETELRHEAQIIDLQAQLKERQRAILENVTAVNDLQGQLVVSQGETRKANRKVRLWKVVSTVLAGGIVYMAIKE